MRATFCSLLLWAIFCLTACFSGSAGGPIPRPAPYTKFFLLNGEQIPLESYKNKVVAVVFWGTWCSSSKSALRGLDELVGQVQGGHFSALAVSLDRESDADEVKGFIEYAELDRLHFAYSGNESLDEAYLSFQAEDVPHIFVVDEHGTIVLVARSAGDVEEYLEERGLL